MRRSPRTLAARAAAVVVALATARVVATDLAALHGQARALGEPRPVVVAAHDLALGATVRRGDVAVVTLHASAVMDGALDDADDALGRVVAVPVLRGAAVAGRHLAARGRRGPGAVVPPGSRAVRLVTADGLRPPRGSVVDVLVSLDPTLVVEGGGGEPAITVARAARVLASSRAEAAGGGGAVTLLVTEAEAHRLAFATANGVVTLALAPPEDACCTTSSSGSSRG